jgi:hypothetical protein
MINTALRYAGKELHVFPLRPNTKNPLPGSHGCKDGTTDTETIK